MTEKPERPCSPRDLMALHSEWLHFGVDSAVRYWQQMGMLARSACKRRYWGFAEPTDLQPARS